MRYLLAVVSALLFLSSHSSAAGRQWPLKWHYLIVTPDDQRNWKSELGMAVVVFRGAKFSAAIRGGDVQLKGAIIGNRVTARETWIGTDANPVMLHGDIQTIRTRLRDASNGWGSDRISLYGRGGTYIGLFRRVRTGAAPGEKMN